MAESSASIAKRIKELEGDLKDEVGKARVFKQAIDYAKRFVRDMNPKSSEYREMMDDLSYDQKMYERSMREVQSIKQSIDEDRALLARTLKEEKAKVA